MRRHLIFVLSGLFGLALLFPSPSLAAGEYKATLKLTSTQSANHPYMVAGQKFADLLKKRTNGRIEVKVYPDSQLAKGERECLEAVQQGTIDIYVGSTGPVGGFSPSMMVLDIPFLFRDFAHVDKVLDGSIGRALLDDLERSGLKGLAFWENGFRHLTNSRTAVKTPADAQGLKIRVMENKVHLTAFKTAGLNPTPMAWGELYPALQQRVIDGQENPVAVFFNAKFYEVQKYFSLTGHVYSPAPVIISMKRWKEMPKSDQETVLETALEMGAYERKINRDSEEKSLQEMAGKGLVVVRDVDKAAWLKAVQPAYAEFAAQFGQEKIDAIKNAK
jgi:TRAP-type transport system periplasmic protein